MELFELQPEQYRDKVLPPAVMARVAVEAAHPMSWGKYVGLSGSYVCMNTFGKSAPFNKLYQEFGFTAENVAAKARESINRANSI
jgi:transketolase